MSQIHQLELRGCAPEPLMAYLKALGIFRIVAEQKDSQARVWWKNDGFFLRSTLDRDAILDFFLHEYQPTPIVSPWNSSNAITSSRLSKGLDDILSLGLPRFQLWNEVVATSRRIFDQSLDLYGSKNKNRKQWILAQCRVQFPDEALDWLDANYVLTASGPKYPPLLGTGGVDGRLEFSRNFMENLSLAFDLGGKRDGQVATQSQVVAALFGEGSPLLVRKRTNGFFNPGSVGGANASVGFNDESMTNPWDYVLMFEGALLFAGAAARRMSPDSRTKAVFPFTVDNSAGGYGTAVDSEYGDSSRAEFWAPVWDNPTRLQELTYLVSEGRAQLGRRQATTGTDFARAVAGLGVQRGISQFQRYGFMVRNGLAYLAAPLGRFRVNQNNDAVDRTNVLFDLDQWLDSFRQHVRGQNAPAGLRAALRRIDDAVIEFCQRGQSRDLQNVLIAVGQMELWLAKSNIRDRVSPLNSLSQEWLKHADDGSREFRIARAIASILDSREKGQRQVGPIRENIEPVDTKGRVVWKGDSVSCVWTAGNPLSNMLSILQRRCLEGRMGGLEYPPLDSAYSSRLTDMVDFMNGDVDIQRVADLVLPLSFVRYWHRQGEGDSPRSWQLAPPLDLPTAYATMKLTLLPREFKCPQFNADTQIPTEPSMLSLLRAGRVSDAYRVACRRLRASGLQPLSKDAGIPDRSDYGRRLAATLLFPLDDGAICALAQRALRPPVDGQESESEMAE